MLPGESQREVLGARSRPAWLPLPTESGQCDQRRVWSPRWPHRQDTNEVLRVACLPWDLSRQKEAARDKRCSTPKVPANPATCRRPRAIDAGKARLRQDAPLRRVALPLPGHDPDQSGERPPAAPTSPCAGLQLVCPATRQGRHRQSIGWPAQGA